jgi:hypothetical protein
MHAMTRPPLAPCSWQPAARFLEASLLFNFLIHAVAMVSMALLLLPGMPGGGVADDASRVGYIAAHPWLWRLGWAPWQLTALADLVLGVALVRTSWVPRGPAVLTVALTLAAIVPDQLGQLLWITRGVDLAREAVRTGDLRPYLQFEGPVFRMVGIFGCIGYLLGALGWTWCFAAAGTWSRRLTWLSVATWGTFAAAIAIYFLPPRASPGPFWLSLANALGFVLLQLWLIGVIERVVGRCRPAEAHGRYAPWRHASRGPVGWAANWAANSHFARRLAEWMPAPALVSDIRDVVYVNYLVEADRLEPLVPDGLELQRLGPGGRYALFTFLTYRHGHFGPRAFGPIRRLLPSPVQSNWRIHVTDPQTGRRGVYFVSTVISSTPHALAGRLLSEGVPMHVPRRARLSRDDDGTLHLLIDPGGGTAPDVRATLRPSDDRSLPPPWSDCFGDWFGFLGYCVPQDRALSSQPWYGRVTRQEIELGIPLESCRRLEGDVESAAARGIVGEAQPLCFHVPAVTFRFGREEYDLRLARGSATHAPGEAPEARPSAARATL